MQETPLGLSVVKDEIGDAARRYYRGELSVGEISAIIRQHAERSADAHIDAAIAKARATAPTS